MKNLSVLDLALSGERIKLLAIDLSNLIDENLINQRQRNRKLKPRQKVIATFPLYCL